MEAPKRVYRLILRSGDTIDVSAEVAAYLKTLQDLVMDVTGSVELANIEVPILDAEITKGQMSFINAFYTLYIQGGLTAVNAETTGGNKSWDLLFLDHKRVARLATVVDYLGGSEFAVFLLDVLYAGIKGTPTSTIAQIYNSIQKRKVDATQDKRPLRLQYARELLIYNLMSALLPSTLVRGIDRRIRKYAEPVIMSALLPGTLVRGIDRRIHKYGEPVILSSSLIFINSAEGVFSNSVKEQERLRNNTFQEFVINPFIATLLDKSGYVKELNKSMTTEPFGNEPFISIWGNEERIVALSNNLLLELEYGDPRLKIFDNIKASTVIDVAIGNSHTLILTTTGVYGAGSDYQGQLGGVGTSYGRAKLLDIGNKEEIEKIWATDSLSVAIAKDGQVYVAGKLIRYGRLGSEDDAWSLLSVGPLTDSIIEQKIRLIAGDSIRVIFITEENRLYYVGISDDGLLAKEAVELLGTQGEIYAVSSKLYGYVVVTTTLGFYMYTSNTFFLKALGGSDSTSSPYLLKMPVPKSGESNKKPRLSCDACFAEPIFLKKDKLFCSRYCMHKTC